jgi:cell division transport system permease protein
MFSKLLHLLSESLRGFSSNKFTTFVVIANIGISLFFIGIFIIAFLNLNHLIESAEEKITFEVFLEDGSADIHILRNEIVNTAGVIQADYISKQDAYEIFKKDIGGEILTEVDGNPLPASFKVKIDKTYRTPEKLEEVRHSLKRVPFVDEVSSIQDWVPKLERIRNIFISVSLAAILILSLAIFFMVSSTIRVTFMARQDLIRVMELVGASENLIKIPFVIEGFVKGLLGGIVSYLLLLVALYFIQKIFPEIQTYSRVPAVQILMGIFIGMIASIRSVKIEKY